MDLVRDLLDKQVVDRNGREIGRADGVVIELRDGAPPQVRGIELGLGVLGYRIAPVLGRWLAALEYACGVTPPGWVAFGEIRAVRRNIIVERSSTDRSATPIDEPLRIDRLLGRSVLAGNNRPAGRIEEFRTAMNGSSCVITEVVIGSAGLAERLGVGVRLLLGMKPRGHVARWDQIDLSNPDHPRLTVSVSELREI